MRDYAHAPCAGGGFFSSWSLSYYMRIISSHGCLHAALGGASLVNSIASHEEDGSRDQVQWAIFDKLECGGGMLQQVLLLAYKSGFQVWDVGHVDDELLPVEELLLEVDNHDTNVPIFDGTNGAFHNIGSEDLPTVFNFIH